METDIIQTPPAPTLQQPFMILRDNKRYMFDPETMVVAQWEGAEREVIEARYYELMREHYDFKYRKENTTASFDFSIPDQKAAFDRLAEDYILALSTEEADRTHSMNGAYDYFKRKIRCEDHYTKMLINFHANLVNSGGRLRMVEALLVEVGISAADGQRWKQMKQEIREKVIPTMTRREVDEVIQNFIHCSEFVDRLTLSYLNPPKT